MNTKSTLFLLLILSWFTGFGQTQVGIIKDPEWNGMFSFISKYGIVIENKFGTTLRLSDNSTAMIIGTPKVDFAIVDIDEQLAQKWITPLNGYPLGIGKFRGNILVIAASDKDFAKTLTPTYKGYLLEEKTGKVISEKVIYEGSNAYLEDPELFFAKDGSYFMMSVRLTAKKRQLGLFNVPKAEKDFRDTQSFTFVDFDSQLNQREKKNPVIPKGDSWTVSANQDGSFLISAIDKASGNLNVAIYVSSSDSPLKTISIPVDLYKSGEIYSLKTIALPDSLTNYIAMMYLNQEKDVMLTVAKVNFAAGTYKATKEIFDKNHLKELQRSFVAVNEKFDDLSFNSPNFLGVKHIALYGDKLLVGLSSRYITNFDRIFITTETSTLLNVYDQNLKQQYHQFLPRAFANMSSQGCDVAYSQKGSNLKMLFNNKPNISSSVVPVYAEMNLDNGNILKMNAIPNKDIKNDYFINTGSVSWMDKSCIIPYFDRLRAFSTKLGMQMQLVNY